MLGEFYRKKKKNEKEILSVTLMMLRLMVMTRR